MTRPEVNKKVRGKMMKEWKRRKFLEKEDVVRFEGQVILRKDLPQKNNRTSKASQEDTVVESVWSMEGATATHQTEVKA